MNNTYIELYTTIYKMDESTEKSYENANSKEMKERNTKNKINSEENDTENMIFKHLILAGGGYKGLYELGVLKYMIDAKLLNIGSIKSIYGTSIGSLLGLLFSLNLNIDDIIDFFVNKPWHKEMKFDIEKLYTLQNENGIFDKSFVISAIEPFLKSIDLDVNMTLKQHYELTNIEFHCLCCDLNTMEQINLWYGDFPDMRIKDAVYASCSIPIILQPEIYKDKVLIDGGVINNYPVDTCFHEQKILDSGDKTVGIQFNSEKFEVKIDATSTLFTIINKLYVHTQNKFQIENIYTPDCEIIIDADKMNISDSVNMLYEKSSRQSYVKNGYKIAEKYFIENV